MPSRIVRAGRPPMRLTSLVALIIGAGVVLGALVPLALVVIQRQQVGAARSRYPAPGQRFDVGGYALHLDCQGAATESASADERAPTVVIDTDSGSLALEWRGVVDVLSESLRVCTYDRAGYGWSDPGLGAYDAQQTVAALHELLLTAGEVGPFLLIGDGLGGVHVRLYAARYPEEVAGLVLVAPLGDEVFSDAFEGRAAQRVSAYERLQFLTSSGLLGLIGPVTGETATPSFLAELPRDVQPAYRALLLDPSHYQTAVAELQSVRISVTAANQALRGDAPLEGLPLIVLTPARAQNPEADLYAGDLVATDPAAVRAQGDLAKLSLRGERRMLGQSGPRVHLDDPASIETAVRNVVAMIKVATP